MFFFFKHKTAYELRISDWSSDVCSSDLRIALPLAISFFTFQKVAYLIDSARGEASRMRFLDFALFAAFFPQLIAGPIVHYKEKIDRASCRARVCQYV